jgi:hypothetical protein
MIKSSFLANCGVISSCLLLRRLQVRYGGGIRGWIRFPNISSPRVRRAALRVSDGMPMIWETARLSCCTHLTRGFRLVTYRSSAASTVSAGRKRPPRPSRHPDPSSVSARDGVTGRLVPKKELADAPFRLGHQFIEPGDVGRAWRYADQRAPNLKGNLAAKRDGRFDPPP